MSKNYKYILDFVANTGKFNNEINGLKSTLKSVGTAAAAYFSVDAVLSFGKASIEAYNSSIQAETALLTALKGRADIQQRLIGQASELMDRTLFDDDEIVRAQSLVAAFVKEEDKIKTLIPLIQDFATAKQIDLAGAADLVTKTLAGEMNALGRYGIKIEGAAGSAERLDMIQRGLNDAFGGQAEAAAKVGTAALTQLSNEYGNLKESIGKVIIENQNLDGSLTKTITGAIAQLNELISGSAKFQLAPLWAEDRVKNFLGNLPKEVESQKKLIGDEIDRLGEELSQRKSFFESNPKFKFDIFKFFFGNKEKDNAEFQIRLLESQSSALAQALKDLVPEGGDDSVKTYANSIEGLNDRLKDYNEQLIKIAPNDRGALMAKIAQINAIEDQISKIDKLKAAIKTMAQDTSSGFRTDKLSMLSTNTNNVQVTGTEDTSKWMSQLGSMNAMLDANQEKVDNWKNALIEKQQAIQDAFQTGFQNIGRSVIDGLGLAESGFEGFIGGLATTVIDLIAMFLSQSLAASIAGATISGTSTGPAAIFTTPAFIATAIAGVMGAFAAIPKFASGGLAYGPTLGLMGEYPGASSNPEVIAPLSKLQAMLAPSGGTTVILQPGLDFDGDRMRIFLKRLESNVNKRT